MKATELRELSKEEILEKIDSWEEELFNLRFQAKMGQLNNALQLRLIRREIARAKTVLNEKNATVTA
ncbi:50S ribosomal protein L29 [Chitinispirillales bacterium ANBcel5]|uniref:50S ribosomal protein L29 n=1 Tax=Cellulosispirillum alkaliphilum TaxID=3039283 RepID=UPI002A545CB8|nr:50S ribosomal protein L29 [Chitinispirillales bacterium ANBcel5]